MFGFGLFYSKSEFFKDVPNERDESFVDAFERVEEEVEGVVRLFADGLVVFFGVAGAFDEETEVKLEKFLLFGKLVKVVYVKTKE